MNGQYVTRRVLHETVSLHEARTFLADWKMLHPQLRHLDTTVRGEVLGDGASTVEINAGATTFYVIEATTY